MVTHERFLYPRVSDIAWVNHIDEVASNEMALQGDPIIDEMKNYLLSLIPVATPRQRPQRPQRYQPPRRRRSRRHGRRYT